VKSSVWFKSFDFLTKNSIDLNRDLNHWFKSHWFRSANPGTDVVESFLILILADNMPNHEKMPELLSYFEHTYIRQWSEADDDQDVVNITAEPSFPLKRGIIMKRGQGAQQEQ